MAVIFLACIILFGLVAFSILRLIKLVAIMALAIFAVGVVATGGISVVVGLFTSGLLYQWLGGQGYEGLIVALSFLAGLSTAILVATAIFKEFASITLRFTKRPILNRAEKKYAP